MNLKLSRMLGEENITCERISGLAMCGVNSDVCTIDAAFATISMALGTISLGIWYNVMAFCTVSWHLKNSRKLIQKSFNQQYKK